MTFDIVVDASIVELGLGTGIDPHHNKWLLSIINDFEDGRWRDERFDNFIWDNIAETALSQKERKALIGQPRSLLVAAAKNLRLTDADEEKGKGSELAEIVLYGIMRHKYGALPVVPKIFYKQNAQDNAKGADSVHIVLTANGGFTLWFGEAKFYNSIEDARLDAIVKSVKEALATDKLKKENSIIVNLTDLYDVGIPDSLRARILTALSNKTSIDEIKPLINVPILLLHECATTASSTEKSSEYVKQIVERHKDRASAYFKKQASALKDVFKYGDVKFHLILFPVPAKEPIIDRFVKQAKQLKS